MVTFQSQRAWAACCVRVLSNTRISKNSEMFIALGDLINQIKSAIILTGFVLFGWEIELASRNVYSKIQTTKVDSQTAEAIRQNKLL